MPDSKIGFLSAVKAAVLGGLVRSTGVGDRQPVLITSLPRSGSSWVGKVLGSTSNALYLREPLRAACSQLGIDWRHDLYVDPKQPDDQLLSVADAAFAGQPYDVRGVFELRKAPFNFGRPFRLVIKEVNLLAAEFIALRYRPKILLLYRHPAAVALSFRDMGWMSADADSTALSFWRAQGERQALLLSSVFAVLDGYEDTLEICYEDVCLDPIRHFKLMAEFAGLKFSKRIERIIERTNQRPPPGDRYSTLRRTQEMAHAWKARIQRDELSALQDAFLAGSPPVYNSLADWSPDP